MDAKKAGDALTGLWIEASDPFEHDSWGYQFRNFQNLKVFKLELETIETKKTELDQIVTHASTWQFMLGNGSIMILNASMTEKTGWIGSHKFIGKAERPRLDNLDIRPQRRSNSISQAYRPVIDRILRRRPQIARGAHSIPLATGEPNPTLLTPRTRLIAAGVKFDTESDPHAATMPYHGLTYYVVNLTWNAAVGSMATN